MNCQLYRAECTSVLDRAHKVRARATAVDPIDDATINDATSDHVPPKTLHRSPTPVEGGRTINGAQFPKAPQDDVVLEPLTAEDTTYFSAFEHVIWDVGIDLSPQFWNHDTFLSNSSLPDEQAAAEQLLALPSPPTTLAATDSNSLPCTNAKDTSGRIFGVDRLSFESPSGVGAISFGILNRKEGGNSQFLGAQVEPPQMAHLTYCTGFTSTAAILARCVREAREMRRFLANHESLRFIVDSGPMCDEISFTDATDVQVNDEPRQIPSTTLAAQCVNSEFAAFPSD